MVFVVKDIIVFRKIKTILILFGFKRYFSHPEESILNLSLPPLYRGIVITGPDLLPLLKVLTILGFTLRHRHKLFVEK